MKGKTNNPFGRPRGVPNRITSEQRQWVTKFLNDMRSDFLECWNLTDPDRRVGYYLKLMEFVIPKPSSITVDMELKQLENLLSKAPQQAIDQIAEKLNELHEQNNEHDD